MVILSEHHKPLARTSVMNPSLYVHKRMCSLRTTIIAHGLSHWMRVHCSPASYNNFYYIFQTINKSSTQRRIGSTYKIYFRERIIFMFKNRISVVLVLLIVVKSIFLNFNVFNVRVATFFSAYCGRDCRLPQSSSRSLPVVWKGATNVVFCLWHTCVYTTAM